MNATDNHILIPYELAELYLESDHYKKLRLLKKTNKMKKKIDSIFYDLNHEVITEKQAHKQVLGLLGDVSDNALPTLKDFAINTFKSIGKQTERLNSGNASHQGMAIRGSVNRAAEFIEKHYC